MAGISGESTEIREASLSNMVQSILRASENESWGLNLEAAEDYQRYKWLGISTSALFNSFMRVYISYNTGSQDLLLSRGCEMLITVTLYPSNRASFELKHAALPEVTWFSTDEKVGELT